MKKKRSKRSRKFKNFAKEYKQNNEDDLFDTLDKLNESSEEKERTRKILVGIDPGADPSVDHPAHYNFGNYEVIDVLEDWKLNFHLGNAVKYIARAGRKITENGNNTLEDLKKARWYLDRYISNLEA